MMSERSDEQPSCGDAPPRRGPLGDVVPDRDGLDPRTRGGDKPEKVEDRPNVGTVTPEDYPEQQ
jgi:hypothetical protein